MAIVSIKIPQLGEGLHEARIVAFLKNAGDTVRRDEPIYQMETDKAVMDVESPYEGKLVEWLAAADQVMAIGDDIARIETTSEVGAANPELEGGGAGADSGAKDRDETTDEAGPARAAIPPRTRAYAKEKGVSDADLYRLAESGVKLMPADIDVPTQSIRLAASRGS
jgi:pyruvate dehydrogenase E2 component (dihydrolipoamide acetyltransferase)